MTTEAASRQSSTGTTVTRCIAGDGTDLFRTDSRINTFNWSRENRNSPTRDLTVRGKNLLAALRALPGISDITYIRDNNQVTVTIAGEIQAIQASRGVVAKLRRVFGLDAFILRVEN